MKSPPARATIRLDAALRLARQSGATIVTAGVRLSRVLRERETVHALKQGREAWASPEILPFSAWIGELRESILYAGKDAALARLDPEAERALWEQIISRSEHGDGLLQIIATAEAAAEAWQLVQAWRLRPAELEAPSGDDTLAFLGWARTFETTCALEGWIDESRLPDFVASRLSGIPLPSTIVLAGFDEFTPQQTALLDACRRAGVEILIVEPPTAPLDPRAVRYVAGEPDEELAAAARWARMHLEQGATSIGVVIPRLHDLRARVERTFAQVLDAPRPLFNLSAGPPLASSPPIHAAFLALELDPEVCDAGTLSRFLRSSFFSGADTESSARAILDARLRRAGGTEVAMSRIERLATQFACPVLVRVLAAWRSACALVPDSQRPAEWARTFSGLLAKLGWPGDRALSSDEYQAMNAWRELLSDFAGLDAVLGPVGYREAFSRLRRMAGRRMFQPESGPAPIQILGALEASGLQFEHLWIAGLDDESWPASPHPAAFIPPALQRARQIPHASPEREAAFARLITERLLRSAEDVVVSHALRDGDRELGPSPLIRDIPAADESIPVYASYFDMLRESSRIECLDDHVAPPVAQPDVAGGTRVFQYQASCPFRAFAELRLGAEALESPVPGLSPRDRGTLAHVALAEIWSNLRSHARLLAITAPDLAALARSAVNNALARLDDRRGGTLSPHFAALEQQRLEAILGDWLAQEKLRRPFTVVDYETERIAVAGGVRCKVKVDRVDRLENGREVIIDYKTGRPTVKSWTGDRPDEPQLPLYAVTHEKPVAAVVFGQLKVGEIGFKGYAEAPEIIPDVAERDLAADLVEWRKVLDRLGADFLNGVADVNPKDPSACRRCSLAALCRFGDADTPSSAFEGNGNGG